MLYLRRTQEGIRPSPDLIAEMDNLGDAGLLGIADSHGRVVGPGATFGSSGGFAEVDLLSIRVTEMGEKLYRVMGLDQILESDLDEIVGALGG